MATASSLTSRFQPQTLQLTPETTGLLETLCSPPDLRKKTQPLNLAPSSPTNTPPPLPLPPSMFLGTVTLNFFPQQMCHVLCHHWGWNAPEQGPSQPAQDQRTRRWPGLEDAPREGSRLRTVTASPMDPQRHPSPGTPLIVPDGAEMLQPLLLQGFLVLQHALYLLLHIWRSPDPLTGHELTGCPDTLAPWRGGAGWGGGKEGMRPMVRTFTI